MIAEKVHDAQSRVDPLLNASKTVVSPSRDTNGPPQREHDAALYKARHVIENFFAKLKQYGARCVSVAQSRLRLAFQLLIGFAFWLPAGAVGLGRIELN